MYSYSGIKLGFNPDSSYKVAVRAESPRDAISLVRQTLFQKIGSPWLAQFYNVIDFSPIAEEKNPNQLYQNAMPEYARVSIWEISNRGEEHEIGGIL